MTKLKYTPEIRERAFQLLIESEKDYPSNWAAITAIAPKIGCTPETLRAWHQKHLGVLGILPPYIAKPSEAPVCRGL